ncbi:MAG: DUF3450 family protein [Pseudomonadota bacterium]
MRANNREIKLRICTLIYVLYLGLSPVFAQETKLEAYHQLVEQWLSLERQVVALEKDWQQQEPALNLRLSILEKEKAALLALDDEQKFSISDVENKRNELLTQQLSLEEELQTLKTWLNTHWQNTLTLHKQLPPPLQNTWQTILDEFEGNKDNEEENITEQLTTLLSLLQSKSEFEQRISYVQTVIEDAKGEKRLLDQVYLGSGQGWYLSADAQHAAVGKAHADGWQWSIDKRLDINEIMTMIAMLQQKKEVDFIEMPIKLGAKP